MWAGIAAWAVFTLLLAAQTLGPEPDPCETYREMRQLWEETNGQAGWPEYVEGKDEECEK